MTTLSARTLGSLGDRVHAPAYDRGLVTPGVVHIGVGGFHRAHQAAFHDRIMTAGFDGLAAPPLPREPGGARRARTALRRT
jgi:hypothetical protein